MKLNSTTCSTHATRRRFLLGVTTALALSVSGAMPAYAAESWNLANAYGPTSIHGEGNAVFAEALAKHSGGDIKVTVHTGGSLGYKSADHFDAVSDGAVEIADTPGNFLGGIDPIMLVSSMPFLANTVDDARLLMEIAMPEYEKVFDAAGQKILYASPWPASGVWGKVAVKSVEDLKGVKIRTFDPNGTNTFKAIGAAPIQLAWADVVPQLATGGISAVLTSAEGGVGQKFVEHTPFFTEINYALPLNFVHMNKAVFDKLSPENQKAVMDAAAAASERNWKEVIGRTQKNYDALTADGGTVVKEHDLALVADLGKAGEGVLNEWLKETGDRGKALIDAFRARKGQ